VDTGVRAGSNVPPQFDSLLAKLIVSGADRQQALRRARRALADFTITGLATVLPFHRAVLEADDFTSVAGLRVHTRWIETDFAAQIPVDPDYSAVAPDGERRTITVDVDGKRLAVGLPADLLDGWARSGQGLPAATDVTGLPGSLGADDSPAESALVSSMSGTVVKWLVEPGAEVAAGDPLVVLEAMKMETQVPAHRAGTLSEVLSAPGGVVLAGAVLAHIE
jgi:acetyl-CoA/propionyl-CoA carboxylase biotin carboxyl carrier protein